MRNMTVESGLFGWTTHEHTTVLLALGLLSLGVIIYRYTARLRPPGFVAADLVLQMHDLNEATPMNLVHMVGRKAGFWGWLNQGTYEMHVSNRFVMIMALGVFDGVHAVIPMEKITTAAYEYSRPIKALMVSIIAILFALFLWPRNLAYMIFFVGAYVFYFHYWRMRAIHVWVSAGDGRYGFQYSIGGASSFQKAAETVNIIRNHIIRGVIAERTLMPEVGKSDPRGEDSLEATLSALAAPTVSDYRSGCIIESQDPADSIRAR